MISIIFEGIKIVLTIIFDESKIVLTLVSICIAYRLLKQTIEQRKDSKMPVMSFRFRAEEIQPYEGIHGTSLAEHNEFAKQQGKIVLSANDPVPVFSYRLVNIGSGPAINVKLINAKANSEFTVDNIIGSGGDKELEVCFDFNTRISNKNLLSIPDTHWIVEYEDVFGRKYKTIYKDAKNQFQK